MYMSGVGVWHGLDPPTSLPAPKPVDGGGITLAQWVNRMSDAVHRSLTTLDVEGATWSRAGRGTGLDVAGAMGPAGLGLRSPLELPSNWGTELYNTSGPNANEPSLSDIHQSTAYGDCYFLASLGALVRADPAAVKNMIHDNGNDTYTVTFYVQDNGFHNLWGALGDSYKPEQVTVSLADIPNNAASEPGDGRLTNKDVEDLNNSDMVIWPSVIEAAYAKMHDTPVCGLYLGTQTGYRNISNGGSAASALETLTGQDSQTFWPALYAGATELGQLNSQFKAGDLLVVETPHSYGNTDPYGLIAAHDYTVTDVYEKNGQEYVSLSNPWGEDQPHDVPVSALPQVSDGIAVG